MIWQNWFLNITYFLEHFPCNIHILWDCMRVIVVNSNKNILKVDDK